MFPRLNELLIRRPVIVQLLRFACIGALNTALDFVVLNLITNALGIEAGIRLWFVNAVGVVLAIIQSYFWNKHWAFAAGENKSLLAQFVSLLLVGGLGFVAFIAAVLPSLSGVFQDNGLGVLAISGGSAYYGIVLLSFVLLQVIFGVHMGFHNAPGDAGAETQFGKFVLVSVVGVIINSTVLAVLASLIVRTSPDIDAALAKNMAKLVAVFVSLAWNFVGYKFFVFRR